MSSGSRYAKSKQQIADEYGICTKTLNKWLKEENMIKRLLIQRISYHISETWNSQNS
jgi:abortive infection bacteriophage resistance protein